MLGSKRGERSRNRVCKKYCGSCASCEKSGDALVADMPAYTLDSNAIIYYTGNDEKAVLAMRPLLMSGAILYVPTVVITEVLSVELSEKEQAATEMIIGTTQVIPFYEHIARLAANIRRTTRLKFPDAAIAATALTTRSSIVTRNVRDFRRVPGLTVRAI